MLLSCVNLLHTANTAIQLLHKQEVKNFFNMAGRGKCNGEGVINTAVLHTPLHTQDKSSQPNGGVSVW